MPVTAINRPLNATPTSQFFSALACGNTTGIKIHQAPTIKLRNFQFMHETPDGDDDDDDASSVV